MGLMLGECLMRNWTVIGLLKNGETKELVVNAKTKKEAAILAKEKFKTMYSNSFDGIVATTDSDQITL